MRLVALTATLAVTLLACAEDSTLAGMVREPVPDVSHVTLPDAANGGQEFTTKAEPEEILVVYFGYTYCPDICPTTLSDLRQAVAELGSGADRIDVAMVTVDPMRDTSERLTQYVQSFFDDAHALRTEDWDLLAEAATPFGASYEIRKNQAGDIEVSHSAFLYAIDPTGHIQVQWPFGMASEDITKDLRKLLKR